MDIFNNAINRGSIVVYHTDSGMRLGVVVLLSGEKSRVVPLLKNDRGVMKIVAVKETNGFEVRNDEMFVSNDYALKREYGKEVITLSHIRNGVISDELIIKEEFWSCLR